MRNIPEHERNGDAKWFGNRARISGIEDSYYSEHALPPPFRTMLPGCIGYIATTGQLVRYGIRPKPETTRQFLDRVEPEIIAAIGLKHVSSPRELPAAHSARNPYRCSACNEVSLNTNRHHPVPLSVRRTRETVRLCLRCHEIIHKIDNRELAEISVDAQLRYIRAAVTAERDRLLKGCERPI